jgi:hypothetical protein
VARGDQLGRQWRLIQLLARPQGLAIADASRELGCHAFRDRLPVPLTLPEAVALLVSHHLLDPGGAGPFGPAVASLVAKIRALLMPGALALIDAMRARVGARSRVDPYHVTLLGRPRGSGRSAAGLAHGEEPPGLPGRDRSSGRDRTCHRSLIPMAGYGLGTTRKEERQWPS